MRSTLPILLIAASACGACRHTGDPPAAASKPPPGNAESAPSPLPEAPPLAKTPPAPATVHYDLAAHVERAELHRGALHVMDYGVPGDAKYTLGGWQSATGRSHGFEEGRARLVPGKVVRLALPAAAAGAARLTLRARGFRQGPLTVHVNGQTVADLVLDGERFQSFDIDLPAGVLSRGENLLQLRVRRTGSAPGVPRAGLAIDWVQLGPADASPRPPPSPERLNDGDAARARLRLPADHRMGYTLQVPAKAQLRARLSEGRIELRALRDGQPALPLGSHEAGELGVDLTALAGELVQLELAATGGDALLQAPRVVSLEPPPPEPKPLSIDNVIVILIDTLRADKLSPYQPQTRVKTPGLSTFLRRAAVLDNARTQENWTKPSVATLLSSLLPWQHNAVTGDAVVPRSVELMPELLRERGFYTGCFIANGYVSDKFGFKQGWHTYRNYIREGRRTKAQYVAADVLDWLDERPKDKPFFLYMHTIDPHVPYRPPSSFVSMYQPEPYSGPIEPGRTAGLLEKIKVGSLKLRERDRAYLEALYDAEISYHDVHFAAVMQGLETRGLADNTMVVITSDHGEEFWDHGSVGHGHSVYDELLHVPLIMRIPGLTEGKQHVADSAGLVDVMPTVLDALGQPIPEHLMGRSLLPALRGAGGTAPSSTVSGFMNGWRTLAAGKLKYVQRTTREQRLYDLSADPGETENVAEQRPIAVRYLRGLLGLALDDDSALASAEVARGKRKHRRQKTAIDKQTEAQLRALGYVGTSEK